MKFKSKFSDLLLLIVTAIAIIVSIVLWIFIMTNDQRFSQINQANNSSRDQIKNRNTKSLYDLYIPTSSYGFKDGELYRLYDSKNNLSFEFSKDMQKLKVTSIKLKSSSQSSYEALLKNDNYIQLTYPDQITFNLFTDVSVKKDNRQFNRIFISLDNNNTMLVGNDKNYKLYQLNLKDANFDRLRSYAKNAHYKSQVEFIRLKSGYTAFYKHNEKWNVYSYLTNRQTDSYFVARLLGTSGVTSRTSKKGHTTYVLNYYTRLKVPKTAENNNDYFYTHYGKNHYTTLTDRFLDSIYYVHRIGLMEQDLRFFDADDSSIKYTNYVEGTPVFLNQHDVQINTNFTSDAITVDFNSTNLQIPIPFDGQTTTLESTNDLMQKLKNHGMHEDEIDEIVVGSKVEKDGIHSNLVNLVPTYYVKAYGEWKSAKEWLQQDLSAYQVPVNQESR